MINSIQNDDHPLPVVTQVSLAGTTSNVSPPLKDKSINNSAKELRDALERHMLGSEYGEQDRKAVILYEYETFKATEGELLLDTYIRYLQVINDLKKFGYKKDNCELNFKFLNNLQPEWKQYDTMMRQNKNLIDINIDALYNILKQNQGDVNEAMGHKKKAVVVTSDPLALVAEKTKVSKLKEKVVVQSESEGSDDEDISDLKKITALLAKAFNRKKYYPKPTNNNLRTSSASSSANKKPEYVKSEEKKEDKKVDEKKRDMSKVKCYNCKKEGHFAKDCKKAKVKDYNYYKTKMLLAKKDNSEESSSSAEETIAEVSYYTSDFESESEYETSEYYDNSTNYGLFVNNDDDQEIFHDAIESASENFNENHIVSQTDHDQSEVDHNDSEDKDHLVDKLIKKFNHKIAKCQKRIEKANQQSKDLENQNKDLQDKYDVLKNQVNTFEEKNNEFNEQIKVLNETNVDLLAQTELFKEQLKVKHVVIDTHTECQAQYAKLEEERYQYMIRYSALCDNDKQHRKKIDEQEILFDKMSRQLVEMNNNVLRLQEKILEKETKILELEEYGILRCFSLIRMKLWIIEKFKRARENKIKFAYDYGNLNASYVNEKINFSDDYFQEIINPDFEKIDSPFQQTSSLKPYVPTLILEKIIIELEQDVLSLLEKEKENLEIIKSLKSKGSESSENAISDSENQSENDCHEVEKGCDNLENSNVIAPGIYSKLNKDVKRYSRKDLLSCNNSHHEDTRGAHASNDAMSVSCNSRLYASCDIVQICLWIIDSGCSKRMTCNRALLTNLCGKFPWSPSSALAIMILRVGQFCDKGLEVAFRKSTCFVRNEDGVDLLTGDRLSNLYTIALNKIASNSSAYEASEVIISLIKKTQVNLQLQVQRVRTDNGTEFKNKTLAKFFDEVGISQQFSAARMPQQNGVVERRNRTLVEAARTMLTFANLPLFLWAETIATACFTQNCLIIHKCFDKTPYELINKRKPNTKFFHVFGCRCYLLNDYDNVGKLKAKGDIGVFVGYSKESAAFRVYNKRTRKIHESVNVNFDEISEMITKSLTTNVETSKNKLSSHEGEVFHEVSESFQEESSSLNDDVQQRSEEVMVPPTNTQSISNNMVPNVNEASSSHNVFNELLEDAYFDASTTMLIGVSAMQDELDQLCMIESMEIGSSARSMTIIKTKWIFKNKKDESSLVIRNKARLVAVGYCQQEGIDYDETFCSTAFSWILKEEVYVGQPPGFVSKQYPDHVYALDKALYGLKQAPRAWYDVLSKFLVDSGFQKGLWYPKDSGFDLTAYSDADHARCHLDRKSTSGSVQFLGDKLVCWPSKKQHYVSISIAESEYVAVSGCCAQCD
ncbi:retrovirus-related pol polyprotein from transposon TNT 1-94 [Tanacetum coccineum]